MTPFFLGLEKELVHAAERQAARRRHRRRFAVTALAAAAVIVVAVFAASLMGDGSDPAVAEVVRVEPQGEQLSVSIDGGAPATEAIAELRAAGFDVTEAESETGPSRVGRIVMLESTEILPEGDAEQGFRFTGPVTSPLTIHVGVASTSGVYAQPTNALLPGEPLHCIGWPGQPAAELTARAAELGITARLAGTTPEPIDPQALDGLVVHSALALGPEDVFVQVTADEPRPQPACG